MLLLLAMQLNLAPARLLHGHETRSIFFVKKPHLGIQEDRRRDTTSEGGVTDIETDIKGELEDEEGQLVVVILSSISSESFRVQVTFGVGRPR